MAKEETLGDFMGDLKDVFKKYIDKGFTAQQLVASADLYVDTIKKELNSKY